MNFDLTEPCESCPFRKDVKAYLPKERVKELLHTLIKQQGTFTCHKTNQHDEEGETVETYKSQHCAGATILLEKIKKPNQMMRWMERINLYDRTKLKMDSPVFDNKKQMINHF